jgi:hypothetical protein
MSRRVVREKLTRPHLDGDACGVKRAPLSPFLSKRLGDNGALSRDGQRKKTHNRDIVIASRITLINKFN